MQRARIRAAAAAGAAIAILAVASPAGAQEGPWPARPIRFLVPFPPGGPIDVLSRQIATRLQQALGQPLVVENVAGAGGGRGLAAIAAAPANGYTIGLGQTSNLVFNQHLYPAGSLRYDSVKDFTPIARVVEAANVLCVNPKEPYRSLAELVAAGVAKPGTINYGSAGNGAGNHLATELLASMTGAKFTHVPYKGNAAALTDLLGGNISFMFNLPIDAVPLAREGKVRALGTTGRTRLQLDSSIPTIGESVPGFEVVSWAAVIAPAGLPREITNRLSDEIAKALRAPEMVERLTKQGWEIAYGTPEQAAQTIRNDLVRWGPIVKASGARVD